MKAIRFHVSVPGYVMARSLGRLTDAATFGALSGVRLEELPPPALPGPEWARLEVLAAGVCGSDIGNVTYAASPAMEPFGSFPAVLGHEILARVVEKGRAADDVRVGQRVVVDPMLSCTVRGHGDSCRSCREGCPSTCERAGEVGAFELDGEPLAPGLAVGYHRDLPGGWGEEMVAHRSQLHPVHEELEDRAAVLIEPLSIGMHAVLRSRPLGPGPALVIGSGPIALGTIWALRAVGYRGKIVGQTKRDHEARLARRMGASEVVSPGLDARQALVETGAMAYQPLVGEEVYSGGGFPLIFDCVGNRGSLTQALRFASPRGRVALLGCASEISKLDLTFVWAREIRIDGFVGYGRERWEGTDRHTFEVTQRKLLETGAPVEELVTHVFPLAEYRNALSAAANHRRSEAVKVLLEP